jgi:hypothetical protein
VGECFTLPNFSEFTDAGGLGKQMVGADYSMRGFKENDRENASERSGLKSKD